jgi:hypothetical protein
MIELIKWHEEGWKGMREDVRKYVGGCLTCQKAKPNTGRQPNMLHPLLVPESPWEAISWDLVRPLPKS